MAVPTYSTDLTTITEASGTTGWDESSNSSWDDAGAMVDETNFYIQNGRCVSAQFTKDGLGTIMFGAGSAITIPTDGAILIWHFWASPPSLATLANGGVRTVVGDSFGDFKSWNASGSDFEPSPLGGWFNFAIDPSQTADYTVGTPTALTHFGMAVSATAQARGNPNAVDAIRYGRCEQIYTNGSLADGYATFSGYATLDNSATNRWGLLQEIAGGFKMQGLMSFGTASTPVEFVDKNTSIVIANTLKVSSNFNKIEVVNASSVVEWTAIAISALGSVSKGVFEVVDDLATVDLISCTFTDMGTFTFGSNSTITNTIHRRCDLVTQNGCTMTGGTIDNATGAAGALSDSLGLITNYKFNSSGTGYAIDLGNITTTQSLTWNNQESGYVIGTAGTDVGVTPTGDETILCNVSAGEVLTIAVASGASTPSVANSGSGTVNVEAGLLPLTITVKAADTGLGIPDANVIIQREDTKATIISGTTNGSGVYTESVAASYNGVDYIVWARQWDLVGTDYTSQEQSGTISSTGADINFSLIPLT